MMGATTAMMKQKKDKVKASSEKNSNISTHLTWHEFTTWHGTLKSKVMQDKCPVTPKPNAKVQCL
jgi:hypothetical protein